MHFFKELKLLERLPIKNELSQWDAIKYIYKYMIKAITSKV